MKCDLKEKPKEKRKRKKGDNFHSALNGYNIHVGLCVSWF
jgi:hypothetical protein